MTIGKVYLINNEPVYITEGAYLVEGRLSNAWKGRYVKKDGSLGDYWAGYGGKFKELKAEIITTVKLDSKAFK